MSDKISNRDYVALARLPELYDGKGWHNKGNPTEVFSIKELPLVFFDFTFCNAGVLTPTGKFVETGQRYAVSVNDGLPIGNAIGERYATPQNAELFELMEKALEGSAYKICSCGTLDDRQEFFVDAKADNVQVAGRTIAPFVGLNRIFGGIGSIQICGHSTVVQCGNTSYLFRKEAANAKDLVQTKNTINVTSRLPLIQKAIEKTHGFQADWNAAMNQAANMTYNANQSRETYVGLIVPDGKELSTRSVNRVNRLNELRVRGAGNKGENVADWASAVTDYYTHENAGSEDSSDSKEEFLIKQWYASERGSGAKIKAEFTRKLFVKGEINRKQLGDWQERGKALIEDSELTEVLD